MSRVTVSQARSALPELLDRVARGEEVTITRHGRLVAVMIRPDLLRSRRADEAFAAAGKVRDLLADGARSPLPSDEGLSRERAEELIAEVRAGRDGA